MSRISIRYAKALFSLAQDEKKLDTVANDLAELKELFNSNVQFKTFVLNPLLSGTKKTEVFKNLFSGKLDPLTMNFLFLLSSKKRVDVLDQILLKFDELLLSHKNQIVAEVTSPISLDDGQLDSIKSNIENITQKSVLIEAKEDSSLIGGFTVKIEDVIIDNSVRYQLSKLKEKLIS
ncbi:MAG: ATP synthase F1 subunit delta [Calditrichaeota bacterium]|nr:ATP synthase F1 subunit delta [Calditrichota bacterium]